jgi:hypothetical protein
MGNTEWRAPRATRPLACRPMAGGPVMPVVIAMRDAQDCSLP